MSKKIQNEPERLGRRNREWWLPYLLVLPVLLLFGAFTYFPFIKNKLFIRIVIL